MPRKPRYFIANVPQHVITRGVDRQAVFFDERDYQHYLKALQDAATASQCLLHAYVLMTNHVRLLLTPEHKRSIATMMQAMGRADPLALPFQPGSEDDRSSRSQPNKSVRPHFYPIFPQLLRSSPLFGTSASSYSSNEQPLTKKSRQE